MPVISSFKIHWRKCCGRTSLSLSHLSLFFLSFFLLFFWSLCGISKDSETNLYIINQKCRWQSSQTTLLWDQVFCTFIQGNRFSKGLGFEEMADYKPSEDPIWKKNVCSQCLYCFFLKIHWHCRLQSVQCENFGVTYRFYIFIVWFVPT